MIRNSTDAFIIEGQVIDDDHEIYFPSAKKVKYLRSSTSIEIQQEVKTTVGPLAKYLPLEMIESILSFIPDEEFISVLSAGCFYKCTVGKREYFAMQNPEDDSEEDLNATQLELVKLLNRRGGLIASSVKDFAVLRVILPLFIPAQEKLKIRVKIQRLTVNMIEVIEKFHHVELERVSFYYSDIHSMLNPRTSKINKLILNNCDADQVVPMQWGQVYNREFVQCFRSLSIINCPSLIPLIKKFRLRDLSELQIIENGHATLMNDLNVDNYPNLTKFGSDNLSTISKPFKKLYLNGGRGLIETAYKCNSITLDYPPSTLSSHNCSELVILKEYSMLTLSEVMNRISHFENVVIPESWLKMKGGYLEEIENPKLKSITIMNSFQNRILVKILRSRLEILFPNACIVIKEMRKRVLSKPSKSFEKFEWEDVELMELFESILKRIDTALNQCIYLREEASKTFLQYVNQLIVRLSSMFEERNKTGIMKDLKIFETETYRIEGFKSNIEFALQNVKHAIEIYAELIGKDETLTSVVMKYQEIVNSSGTDQSLERNLKLVENNFVTLKTNLELKGFSYKLLFKNLWQSDDVVEFYRSQELDDEDFEIEELEEYDEYLLDEDEYDCSDSDSE